MMQKYMSQVVSTAKNNPKIAAGIALGCVATTFIMLYPIPSVAYYSGIDKCATVPNCNGKPSTIANGVIKQNVEWTCNNVTIRGYLLIPNNAKNNKSNACIIMAHGLGHLISHGLIPYANAFAKAGYIVLLFDYRTFGISDGLPRQQASADAHVKDWISAINYIKNNQSAVVDINRIGLWGTSFSGGHVLVVSSLVENIKAIVSQVPLIAFNVDEIEKAPPMSGHILKLLLGCLLTKIRTYIPFCNELYCRIWNYGNDGGGIAFIDFDLTGETETQQKFVNDEWNEKEVGDYKNAISLRNAWEIVNYKPYRYIDGLNKNGTNVLYIGCEHDLICPMHRLKYADSITNKSIMHEEMGVCHFSIYQGEIRSKMIKKQIEFFDNHLNTVVYGI